MFPNLYWDVLFIFRNTFVVAANRVNRCFNEFIKLFRTEAIHVGDEILSINGVSLRDKTLLECAKMLEDAEIVVGMQIRKQDPLTKESMFG